MNTEIQKMLEKYPTTSPSESKNALKEVIQELTLHILSQTDFFSHAAFYGGTALRIFYGLDRFSEDMDFSLQTKIPDFSLKTYLPIIAKGLNSYGFEMQAEYKEKHHDSAVQSAFLKGNTLLHVVKITALSPPIPGIPNNELIKIKVEIDTNPPPGATFEQKFKLLPQPYSVLLYDKPSLFAGKMHALLCRNWKTREKGRDFYDYVWYLKENTPLNLIHLEARMRQSGHWEGKEALTLASVKEMLLKRFALVDFSLVKEDVLPYISDNAELDIWSEKFFSSITQDMLKEK
jgi:hypothetical protein